MEIKIKNLKKHFGKKQILDIKDLEFPMGKCHTIMGVNGCGKTTLLKLIAGLDKNYSGEIFYNNFKLTRDKYKDITYVGQKSYLLKGTVIKNIEYPLKLRGCSKEIIREKTNEYIKLFQLEEIQRQCTSTLSSGEGQRLALARALVFNPKLLILDEAMANINEDFVFKIENILKEKCKDMNVIVVSHNLEQAKRLSEKQIIIN